MSRPLSTRRSKHRLPCPTSLNRCRIPTTLEAFAISAAILVTLAPATAFAQGISCAKARSSVEKSICASPHLLALDHQVALAYADALKRTPDRRVMLRQDLLRWLKARDVACTVAASRLADCLDE